MRIIVFFCLLLCSCKSNFTPAPPAIPEGKYQGYDSVIYQTNDFSQKMFGNCIEVKKLQDGYGFFDRKLEYVDGETYKFDFVTATDFGVGTTSDIHHIRRVGTFKFSYNHLIVEYSVGDSGKVMSQYKFNGWR